MNTILIGLAVLFVIGGLVFVYGKNKEKIGELKQKVLNRKGQRERESKAKKIEAEPSPTSPDDVADAWDKL